MEDFLTSERFEQMAREYNAKYRHAAVLGQDLSYAAMEQGKARVDDVTNAEIAKVLEQMLHFIGLCDARICGNVRFLSVNNLKLGIEKEIHKFATQNGIEFANKQNSRFFLANNKILVQKFIEIEKFFCKKGENAKVQCLCDIHDMFLNYFESFFWRI